MKKLLLVAFIACSLMNLQSCANYGDDNVAPSGGGNNGGGNNGGGNNGGGNNGGGNNGGGGNTTTANLPVKITTGDDIIEFKYNNDDRFTQITKKRKGSLYEKTDFEYSGDTLKFVKKLGVNESYTVDFNYSKDTVFITRNSSNKEYEEKYIIDNQGSLLEIKSYSTTFNRIFNNDSNGNIIFFNNNGHQANLKHDNKNGIFKNVKLPYWAKAYIAAYYIHSSINYNYSNNVVNVDYVSNAWNDEHFTYSYNKDNFPSQVYHSYSSSVAFQIEYSK